MSLLRYNNDYIGIDHILRVQHDPDAKLLVIQTTDPDTVIRVDGSGVGKGKNPAKYTALVAWLNDNSKDVTTHQAAAAFSITKDEIEEPGRRHAHQAFSVEGDNSSAAAHKPRAGRRKKG